MTKYDTPLDNDAHLMIALFRQHHPSKNGFNNDPPSYLSEYTTEIESTGRLFEYLGLAAMDGASAFG
jgi:hypothetical protein